MFQDDVIILFVIFRTGKRTPIGALKDGVNSAIRYYYNNFADGFRQVRERGREGGRERDCYYIMSYRMLSIYSLAIISLIHGREQVPPRLLFNVKMAGQLEWYALHLIHYSILFL